MGKTKTGKRMNLITVHIPEQQLKGLDMLVNARIFPSRSEAIRAAIRDLIDKYSSFIQNKYGKFPFSFPGLNNINQNYGLMLGQR
ncbi:MAG TPA: ribbon-helix-helix protein, CopG family [Thermoprotei archaeon]|nr:ribbon-helix-helix protein, CopG family [Thermoprotei archaeon]